MATTCITYNRHYTNLQKKLEDMVNDDIKVALVLNTYTPDRDHNTWETGSDPFDKETSGTGYTAGGLSLAGKTVTQDDVNDRGVFSATNLTFSTVSITFRYVIIYNNTLANKDLIYCIDMGQDITKTAEDLTLEWDSDGIGGLADLMLSVA